MVVRKEPVEKEKLSVLKTSEVARLLRVDSRTVYGMIERGELPAIKAGRVLRVPSTAVEELLKGKRLTGS